MDRRYASGTISQDKLAEKYGMGQTQVGRIIHGKTWKHLDGNTAYIPQ